jgi:hypothetical protein
MDWAPSIAARRLRSGGRRRVSEGPGWVESPTVEPRGRPGPTHHTTEEKIMKWTKPEAEVVAVTMEVTAYVATL